jgi:hypothetical protein
MIGRLWDNMGIKKIQYWCDDNPVKLYLLSCSIVLSIAAYAMSESIKQKTLIQKSKVIIPNITRDNHIDKKEISDVFDLTDSYINQYNKVKIKITSEADLDANEIISQMERNVLHNKIDSVITSYNAKDKTVTHKNSTKSNLYKLIHSPIKNYNLKK